MSFTLVVSGDTILNHRASVCEHPGFLEVVALLRGADVTHTQFEQIVHDFEGPEVYPSVEGAWSWFRSPSFVADELRWLGVDLVSTASNHSLDYSYGPLRSTWAALDEAGIPHAGTGPDLAAALAPAFLDTRFGRVALVSACSSIPLFARAGWRRPGVAPLLDEDDLETYLRAVRHALAQSDFTIAHLHAHEWDAADGRIETSWELIERLAHAAVDAGAGVVIVQGSHAPMRGIEVYAGRVIFYDPGDLHRNGRVDKHPADFYLRWGYGPEGRKPDAGVHDGYAAREAVFGWREGAEDVVRSPLSTYSDHPGFFLPVCHVDDGFRVTSVDIHPLVALGGHRANAGLPALATGEAADTVLGHLERLCEPYGTTLRRDGDVARLVVA